MAKYMNFTSKLTIGVAALAGGVGAGVGVFIAMRGDDQPSYSKQLSVAGKVLGVDIETYQSTKSGQYYIKPEEIGALYHLIEKDLSFGPEFAALNKIHIGNENGIQDENNGVYLPSTKEIFINTNNLAETVPYTASLDARAANVFDILFHEYNHHMASMYLINNSSTSPVVGNYYSDVGGKREKTNWNKYFVDRFKKALHYDVDTPTYTGPSTARIKNPKTGLAEDWLLIPHYMNAKDIFEFANGSTGGNLPIPNKNGLNMMISNDHPSFYPGESTTPEKINYKFSLDELFARKYQLANQAFRRYSDGVHGDGWIPLPPPDEKYASPSIWLSDIHSFQNGATYNSKRYSHDQFRYLHDAPFDIYGNLYADPTIGAQGMHDAMIDFMGQTTGDDISFITNKPYSIDRGSHSQVTGGDPDKIKFGGWIRSNSDPNLNYKYVGYIDNGTFKAIPITLSNQHYKTKTNLMNQPENSSSYISNDPSLEDMFYVTSNWVDAPSIKGKQLFFSTKSDGSDKVPMTSVRTGTHGEAHTYVPEIPSQHTWMTTHQYHAKVHKVGTANVVSIEEESWGA